MKRLLTLITLLFLFASASALAQNFNKGVAAFQSGDYATAMQNWLPLAEKVSKSA